MRRDFFFLIVMALAPIMVSFSGCGGGGGGSANPHFRATQLSNSATLNDLNDLGQFAGVTPTTRTDVNRAVLVSNQNLIVLNGVANQQGSSALAVNNRGQLTGYFTIGTSAPYADVFFYSNNQSQAINHTGIYSSYGQAINDQGDVAGIIGSQAFLWQAGKMTLLTTSSGGYSNGRGINNQGQVVGAFQLANGTSHAFLWSNGQMTDLGTLPGVPQASSSSSAEAINNRGQIVGSSDGPDGNTHAVLWENGAVKDLGVLPGNNTCVAQSINDQGDVVGSCYSNAPGQAKSIAGRRTRASGDGYQAFLYHAGKLYNLNDLLPTNSGWSVGSVIKINNRGQILANGTFQDKSPQCLLTPQ